MSFTVELFWYPEVSFMKYLYAILPTPTGGDYEPMAFASPDGRFEVISDGTLAAVVSETTTRGYTDLPRGDVMRALAQHQAAIEALMEGAAALLPVKFGTVLADEGQVRSVLYLGRPDFERAFELVGDRGEVDVAVTWEPTRIFAEIAQTPELVALKAEVEKLPADKALAGKVAVGRLVKEQFDARRNALRDALVAEITPHAARWRLNPVMDDSMVMNVACLVNVDEETALEDRVYELDEQHTGQLNFRLIGPLPPYSFATVEARVVRGEDVAQASALLGLNGNHTGGAFGSWTPEQVKYAYYAQARRYHPDAVGNDPAAMTQFVHLTAAYRLMTEVALRVPAGALADDAPYILVRVGGPEG
jgi:hypothetical protein